MKINQNIVYDTFPENVVNMPIIAIISRIQRSICSFIKCSLFFFFDNCEQLHFLFKVHCNETFEATVL